YACFDKNDWRIQTAEFYRFHDAEVYTFGSASSVIYTLSLHDALPILLALLRQRALVRRGRQRAVRPVLHAVERRGRHAGGVRVRSEEHTSELQSRGHLVCRLLLEKKNFVYF